MVPPASLSDQVDKVTQRLTDEFSPAVSDDVVRGLVSQLYGELASARVTQFVPVLVARKVREELRHRVALSQVSTQQAS